MKKMVILVLILVLIFIGIIFLKAEKDSLYTHSLTKAICTNNNYCEDYEIFCYENNILSMRPTGATIQFAKDWKDPRNKEIIDKFC